jgi:hypothetical protein
MIIAMHPDQALNAVLELAISLDKPFVVLPCCVFARDFPRKLRTQQAVSTYEDLLTWVEEQALGVRRVQLPFAGKNVMLYRPK